MTIDMMCVTFLSATARDCFFEYANSYRYRFTYDNFKEPLRKECTVIGGAGADGKLYLKRKGVVNYDKLVRDIRLFGGRISRV